MRYKISLTVLLAVFWLSNSGHYTPLMFSLGAASVALVMILARRLEIVDHEAQPLHVFPHILLYWIWLAKEIVWANIDVVYRIWRGNGSIQPTRLVLETAAHSDVGKTILANSVTLTPGTVTLDIQGNEITIHALSQRGAKGLASMDRRVSKVEA